MTSWNQDLTHRSCSVKHHVAGPDLILFPVLEEVHDCDPLLAINPCKLDFRDKRSLSFGITHDEKIQRRRILRSLQRFEVLGDEMVVKFQQGEIPLRVDSLDLSLVAVTHCPLTGSSLVFDRSSLAGAELGVSGLLYRNNLIMYDRNGDESLWPQMLRGARCGSKTGAELEMVPAVEMSWEGWQTLHPQTLVVSSETEFGRNYRNYPYGDYDRIDNRELLFPLSEIDSRRPPKERVLGIPDGEAGRAYPYGVLGDLGSIAVVQEDDDVIFWDSQRQAAMAYYRILDGETLEFRVVGGQIRDASTESIWQVDGLALSGPLAGRKLAPVAEAFVSFWFAWAVFHPDATLWSAP